MRVKTAETKRQLRKSVTEGRAIWSFQLKVAQKKSIESSGEDSSRAKKPLSTESSLQSNSSLEENVKATKDAKEQLKK